MSEQAFITDMQLLLMNFCKEHGLKPASADEIETDDPKLRNWLSAYCDLWDVGMDLYHNQVEGE